MRDQRSAREVGSDTVPEGPKTIEITVEPLTPEVFEPFGEVICERPTTGDSTAPGFNPLRVNFEVDGTPTLGIVRYPYQDMSFSEFERHPFMTESRVPLSNMPVVMVVAEPTPLDDLNAFPDPADFRAFLMEARQGLLLRRGTWHALDCFPIAPPFADFAFFTEKEAEEELIEPVDLENLHRSQIIDYESVLGIRFRIENIGQTT